MNKKRHIKEIGQRISIGERFIHAIVCDEKGRDYTVILDAGLSCCSIDWHYIQPQIAKFACVLSFDRAGYGWSSPANMPYTSEDVVSDLVHILKKSQLKPPYILVGHSFGGLNMRLFASKYPEQVAALILIDAVHEKRYLSSEWDAVRKNAHSKSLKLFRLGYLTSGIGLPKLLKQPVGRKHLPRPYQKYVQYLGYHPKCYEAAYNEFLYSELSAMQVVTAPALKADLPIIVLSSNNTDSTWVEHQSLLSQLTAKTTQIQTSCQHSIHLENPHIVIKAIQQFIENEES